MDIIEGMNRWAIAAIVAGSSIVIGAGATIGVNIVSRSSVPTPPAIVADVNNGTVSDVPTSCVHYAQGLNGWQYNSGGDAWVCTPPTTTFSPQGDDGCVYFNGALENDAWQGNCPSQPPASTAAWQQDVTNVKAGQQAQAQAQQAQAQAQAQAQQDQQVAQQQTQDDNAVDAASQQVANDLGNLASIPDTLQSDLAAFKNDLQTQQKDLATMGNDEQTAEGESDPDTACDDADDVVDDADNVQDDADNVQDDMDNAQNDLKSAQAAVTATNNDWVALQSAEGAAPSYTPKGLPTGDAVTAAIKAAQGAIATATAATQADLAKGQSVASTAQSEAAAFNKQYCTNG